MSPPLSPGDVVRPATDEELKARGWRPYDYSSAGYVWKHSSSERFLHREFRRHLEIVVERVAPHLSGYWAIYFHGGMSGLWADAATLISVPINDPLLSLLEV